MRRVVILLVALVALAEPLMARERTAEELRLRNEQRERRDSLARHNDRFPIFGLFRNNYLATGVATDRAISSSSADVKFQFSIGVRLWGVADKADFLFTYSQHSVWDIYRESCPFRETAYNPGFWAAWQVRGDMRLLFGFEHESNGMGGTDSRSFNYLSAACIYEPFDHWRFGLRLWYGYYDRKNIDSYFRYRGVGHAWATFHTLNDRFSATVLVNPSDWMMNYNVQVEASWRLARRGSFIPSLYVQYACGYGDTMLDYNRYSTKIRIGISLVNNKLGFY